MDRDERRPLLPQADSGHDSVQNVVGEPTPWYSIPPPDPPPAYCDNSKPGTDPAEITTNHSAIGNPTHSYPVPPPLPPVTAGPDPDPEGVGRRPLPLGFPVLTARVMSAVVLVLYMAASIGSTPLQAQYVYVRLEPHYINISDSSVDTGACTANYSDPRVQALAELQVTCSVKHDEGAVAEVLLYFSLANTGPMVLTTILLGAYSDVIGRKLLFLLPTAAGLVEFVVTAVIVKLELSLDYFYLLQAVEGFSGSFCALLLATFAYTADLTPPAKSRTFAITILECCLALAGAGASVGYLILYVSYFFAALLLAMLMGVAVAIVIFVLPETIQTRLEIQGQQVPSRNPLKYVRHIFGFYLSGSSRRRVQFLLALTILCLSLLCFIGRVGVETLYQLNAPFCFNSAQIGVYGAVSVGVRALGSLAAVHVLQNFMSDPAIAAVTLLSGVAANVIEGLAGTTLVLYMSTVAGAISNAAVPVTRAILSKMAGASKQGALFASVAVMESLCSLASNSMFNSLYQATVGSMRGAVFLYIAGIVVLCFLLVLVFMRVTAGGSLLPDEQTTEHVQQTSDRKEQDVH
ncbi:hypothetical protein BaRGS_00021636 [Batillaria attramentaria]|uniref:Major facilitator superfamily (MFS) profile domain-containing protein n=1 Tax=Batillaria attramentaria TaxID=370345 RepID=A0ABD0KJ74_9CAEN